MAVDPSELDSGAGSGSWESAAATPNEREDRLTPEPVEQAPDFARFIPQSSWDQAQNQQKADDWASGARETLANLWGQVHTNFLQQSVANLPGSREPGVGGQEPIEATPNQREDREPRAGGQEPAAGSPVTM